MAIDSSLVKHVAGLARLRISTTEAETYTGQLSRILGLMDELNELDTADVKPMSHAVDVALPQRSDSVVNANQRDALLAGAPESEEGHFRVPKIIE